MIDFGDDALTVGRAAPDDRPDAAARGARRPAAAPASPRCCCSTSCSATAPTPTRPVARARAHRRPRGHRRPGRGRAWSAPRPTRRAWSRQADALRRGRCRGLRVQRRRRPGTPLRAWEPAHDRSALGGLLAAPPAVVAAGVDAVRRRAARPGRRRARRRLAAADPGSAGRPRRVAGSTRGGPRPTRDRRRAHAGRPVRASSTSGPAREVIGLGRGTFLHAGPPLDWERASGPLRGALIGAACSRAGRHAARRPSGSWPPASSPSTLPPPRAVGPDGGGDQPVDVDVRARGPGARRHAPTASLNEGLGKVLRYGAYGPEVIDRLRWMRDVLGPLLSARGARAHGPIDVKAILAQMLQMGDEGHNRNRAGTLMLLRELLPAMIDGGRAVGRHRRGAAVRRRQRPLLPQPRHAGVQAGHGRRARRARLHHGRRDGPQRHRLRHPGLRHRRPLVHRPGQTPDGLFLGAYGPDDANPDIGDSAITETAGRRRLRDGRGAGDRPLRRRRRSPTRSPPPQRMYEITLAENPAFGDPDPGLPRHPDRHRRHRGGAAPASCRRSTPAWPAGSPAPARSAPVSSPRRRSASSRPSPPSPKRPAPPDGPPRSAQWPSSAA